MLYLSFIVYSSVAVINSLVDSSTTYMNSRVTVEYSHVLEILFPKHTDISVWVKNGLWRPKNVNLWLAIGQWRDTSRYHPIHWLCTYPSKETGLANRWIIRRRSETSIGRRNTEGK